MVMILLIIIIVLMFLLLRRKNSSQGPYGYSHPESQQQTGYGGGMGFGRGIGMFAGGLAAGALLSYLWEQGRLSEDQYHYFNSLRDDEAIRQLQEQNIIQQHEIDDLRNRLGDDDQFDGDSYEDDNNSVGYFDGDGNDDDDLI